MAIKGSIRNILKRIIVVVREIDQVFPNFFFLIQSQLWTGFVCVAEFNLSLYFFILHVLIKSLFFKMIPYVLLWIRDKTPLLKWLQSHSRAIIWCVSIRIIVSHPILVVMITFNWHYLENLLLQRTPAPLMGFSR